MSDEQALCEKPKVQQFHETKNIDNDHMKGQTTRDVRRVETVNQETGQRIIETTKQEVTTGRVFPQGRRNMWFNEEMGSFNGD